MQQNAFQSASAPDLVKKGYTVTLGWDHSSILSKDQIHILSVLSSATTRPSTKYERSFLLQERVEGDGSGISNTTTNNDKNGFAIIYRSEQFHEWFGALAVTRDREVDAIYLQYSDELSESLRSISKIVSQICIAWKLCRTLSELYFRVRKRGESMRDECERLLIEKQRLTSFANALDSKLLYFEELEVVANSFSLPAFSGADFRKTGEFLPFLHRLDLSLDFVQAHPHYTEGNSYGLRFQQVRSRAMASVRELVCSILDAASTAAISSHVRNSVSDHSRISESKNEAQSYRNLGFLFQNATSFNEIASESSLHIRFRAAAAELKDIMIELEKREERSEYKVLIADCHIIYCENRIKLLQDSARACLQKIVCESSGNMITLCRESCTFLVELIKAELSLFSYFFSERNFQKALSSLIQPLGAQLFDALRPSYILIGTVHELSEIVYVLKGEIIQELLVESGESGSLLIPLMNSILADIQERLIFRAQTLIRDEVGNHTPSESDINYPEKLEIARKSGTNDLSTWYPPLEKTLKCLGHLYRCVEESTFSGLAQEAVTLCSDNLGLASKVIARTKGNMNGQLFLIKHLLILREQIAPFNTDFCVAVKELDFSHLGTQMKRILGGEISLFAMTPENALMVISSEGRPRVIQSTMDSRKELEKQLKLACETFILFITKILVGPILGFITKATAIQVSKSRHEESLSNSAFSSVDKLKEIVLDVDKAIDCKLPEIIGLMNLYIHSTDTKIILLNPIFSNVIEAHSQFSQLLCSEYDSTTIETIECRGTDSLEGIFRKYI